MKYLVLMIVVLGISTANAKDPVKTPIPVDPYTDCGHRSLLYNIAATIRDDEVPRKKALLEFKKQSRISDLVIAEDIIKIVYDDLSAQTPRWIEGYVYGLCIMVSNTQSNLPTTPSQQRRQM